MHAPLKVGALELSFRFVLAPMAGYTDSSFRSICRKFGAGAVYTEVVNARSITRKSKPTIHLLESTQAERPAAAHIYGNEPEIMAEAAQIAQETGLFDFIDVNCGCPVRKIVSKGSGAALMRDPGKIHAIVRAITRTVSIPVTVKIRLGPTPDMINIEETADAAQSGGAQAIAVHARTADQGHTGPTQWDFLYRLRQILEIPVIGNGGIKSAQAAIDALNGGVDGVMIATGAVGNPWIFRQIHEIYDGKEPAMPTFSERREIILEHLDSLIALKHKEAKTRRMSVTPEVAGVLHFRSHLYRYLKGTPGFSSVRANLQFISERKHVYEAIDTSFGNKME